MIYCDFFKLDPRNCGTVTPPVMTSDMLFQSLGVKAHPWKKGFPLKVVGILPVKTERNTLWKILHDLYSCSSVYKYGRAELNLFISEKECWKLMANSPNSRLISVIKCARSNSLWDQGPVYRAFLII